MSMMNERWLEVAFAGGRALSFKGRVRATERPRSKRIEVALKRQTLVLALTTLPDPTSAIQRIAISPAPQKLPRIVIGGAALA